MSFTELLLSEPILRAVVSEGYTVATPVQAQAIPQILRGRDVLGCAQTGTGKTAAFALPILHRLSIVARPGGIARPRCLVLCPTRELATQIGESFRVYGKHVGLRSAVVFGGVGVGPQAEILRRGVDILVATPGRLLDLLNQHLADLRGVEILVLDEADRMLDMGFIQDIRKIIAGLPSRRQTLLFSATIPQEIRKLACAILRDAVTIQIAHASPAADRIDQSVYFVPRTNKPALLAHLVNDLPMSRAIVFTRTKHGADRLVRRLHDSGIRAEAIHGNKSQNARQRALHNFRSGKLSLLVATDVASRGIDVDGISHVVNYDLTDEPETYVHRIGRTARAGASGAAVSFCDPEEMPNLRAIEKLIRRPIPVKTASGVVQNPKPETRNPNQAPIPKPEYRHFRPQPQREAAPSRHPAQPQRHRRPHPLHGHRRFQSV
ncbi:MAG TPA: DEAD/DEAH box helicase [Tepidisphaeraceae bacterium]|nr:DEAD/DEAH box helicase [Tepidisphaeraceae bacterium]